MRARKSRSRIVGMNVRTQRHIVRWVHIVLSVPILGYIYGPVASMPIAANVVRFVLMPVVIVSGFWMWKGHVLVRFLKAVER
jgi:hypothetical protein